MVAETFHRLGEEVRCLAGGSIGQSKLAGGTGLFFLGKSF